MDRKSKVWLIVLIVLLILAVAGMIISRNQLVDIQARTAAVNAQLAEAQSASGALQSELDAAKTALTESQTALTETQSQVETLSASLAAEQEKVAVLESSASSEADIVSENAPSAEIEARVAELEAALAEANARIAELSVIPAVEDIEADNEQTVVVTEATQWRSAPGEEGQALADLSKGDELNYMNQTATDAQDNEWICAGLYGQTGWVPASCAKVEAADEPTVEPTAEPAAEAVAETSSETVAEASDGMTADVNELNRKLAGIMSSDASDEEKLAEIAALEEQLNKTIADLTAVSGELEAQSAALRDAETALNAKEAELENANSAIAELESQIAEIGEQTESESAARAELEERLTAAQENSAAIETELAAARVEYEKRVAEMEAYLISRELIDGEAHVATSADSEVNVAADGVTAAFHYTNNSVSGNAVVLTIVKDDVELYRSEPIAPGQSVSEIVLAEALTAGVHEAIAVTTVYNEDGSVQLTSRVPVTLNVAE